MERFLCALALVLPLVFDPIDARCQGPTLAAPAPATSPAPVPGCATDEMRARQPLHAAQRAMTIDRAVYAWVQARAGGQRDVLTIPVAVHIIHGGGNEDIPDAQVLQGIEDLNDAFANTGAYHHADGVDAGIRFCLARQDPNGIATTGITRVLAGGGLTEMVMEVNDLDVKSFDRWDPERYLNIWLVREIASQAMGSGVAGYAYFPSSHGGPEDGIVNEARWFGSSTDNSKVHIHEVGHYLGLYHTFEGGCTNNDCLMDGDHVCDTPPDGSSGAVPCGIAVNTCTTDADDGSPNNPFRPVAQGGLGDSPDLFEDYMDYGLQSCQHLFTAGQADRMNAMLNTARASLLGSTGCQSPCPGLITAAFLLPEDMMAGTPYVFVNAGGAVVPIAHAWYVDGMQVSTAEDLSWTFTTAGEHTVVLRLTNIAEGCYDEESRTITVLCDVQAAFTMTPTAPDVGEAVTLTSLQPAPGLQWSVDDAPIGSGPSFTTSFPEGGGYSIRLIAQGTGCADTSAYRFLPVGPCATGANNTLIAAGGNIISFNGGGPATTSTPIFPIGGEGVSSVCDANGDLLLYSDGLYVFNGAHEILASNLLGGGSSTQACLIVPKPGSSTVFYIFTTDDWVGTGGGWMTYSEVDLSLNGGHGGMVQTNVPLMNPTSEKLAAVRNCNGEDIWVIGLSRNSGTFHAYSVTAAGVNTNAVISTPGFDHSPSLGALKGSPKGNKLAGAFRDGNPYTVMLFDLDNSSGVVTNPVALGATPHYQQYGVEFSADGSKLYASNADDGNATHQEIVQYDLTSGIPAIMQASRTVVGISHSPWAIGSLQRAVNGRIYLPLGMAPSLGEIRSPDLPGTACEYVDFAVPLVRPTYGFGLSNMVPTVAELSIPSVTGPREVCPHAGHTSYELSCTGNAITLQHHGPSTVVSFDGRDMVLDIQEPGVDTLVVLFDNPCSSVNSDTVLITVGAPVLDLGPDTVMCSSAHLLLDAGADAVMWEWHSGGGQVLSLSPTLEVQGPGTYSVIKTGLGGCSSTDGIVVSTFPSTFQFSLGPDRIVCPGPSVPVTLHAPPIDALAYHWINGASTDSMTINSFWSSAWLTITDMDGCTYTDTLLLVREDTAAFAIDLGPDAAVCPGQVWPLDAGTCAGCTYHWHDGSTEHGFTAFGPGTYSVEVISACHAHATDAVTLAAAPAPALDLGPDQLLCPFAPFTLDPGLTGVSYHWEDGSTAPTHVVDSPDLYWVTVMSNAGCSATDSLEVSTCTGIAGTTGNDAVRVQPNPANEGFRLTITGRAQGPVELLDALGRVVRSVPLVQDSTGAHADVATDRLANGAYVVRLREREDTAVRVVVAH